MKYAILYFASVVYFIPNEFCNSGTHIAFFCLLKFSPLLLSCYTDLNFLVCYGNVMYLKFFVDICYYGFNFYLLQFIISKIPVVIVL